MTEKQTIDHPVGENKDLWKIGIDNGHSVHVFSFYLSDAYSTMHVHDIIQDALILAERKLMYRCPCCEDHNK